MDARRNDRRRRLPGVELSLQFQQRRTFVRIELYLRTCVLIPAYVDGDRATRNSDRFAFRCRPQRTHRHRAPPEPFGIQFARVDESADLHMRDSESIGGLADVEKNHADAGDLIRQIRHVLMVHGCHHVGKMLDSPNGIRTSAATSRGRTSTHRSTSATPTRRATLPRTGRVAPSRCSIGSPNGIRTRAATLRGWCPRPLDERAKLPTRRYRRALRVLPVLCHSARRPSGWGARNRTLNKRTRNSRVANYTTPHWSDRRLYRR